MVEWVYLLSHPPAHHLVYTAVDQAGTRWTIVAKAMSQAGQYIFITDQCDPRGSCHAFQVDSTLWTRADLPVRTYRKPTGTAL